MAAAPHAVAALQRLNVFKQSHHWHAGGAIAGIVIGSLVGVALIAFVAVLLLRRRQTHYVRYVAGLEASDRRAAWHCFTDVIRTLYHQSDRIRAD